MSTPHSTAPHRRSAWLRGCLSLTAIGLLIILMAGTLARFGIQRGSIQPPQGRINLGLVKFYADIPGCPAFPRCTVGVELGNLSAPLMDPPVFKYIILIEIPGVNGPTAYRLVDIPMEGATLIPITLD
jgi:hypothetical protein